MIAIVRSTRPRRVMQTPRMMAWVRLSIVNDEEVEADAATVELNGEEVSIEVEVGLVGMT
jgi:hypothetical protein